MRNLGNVNVGVRVCKPSGGVYCRPSDFFYAHTLDMICTKEREAR